MAAVMMLRARMVFRDGKPPSRLESRFELLWRALGGPVLAKEFRFHPVRKWRADFAHLPSHTLIEIEGTIRLHGLRFVALRFGERRRPAGCVRHPAEHSSPSRW
jgi:hypothetical protein